MGENMRRGGRMNQRKTEGVSGLWGEIKIKPVLTEQPCVSECACMSVSIGMHVLVCPRICVVTCLSPAHLLPLLHTLQATAPHLTWPCPALQGQSQKKRKKRRGTVFYPCGGQSLWIRQPSLGPSPVGSGAQQAPSSPQEDGGL